MLAVLCMANFSVTAFAYEGGETATAHDAETAADPKEDLEIPYSCIIDEYGNLVITIGGVTDPAELETVGTVVTGGSCLNVRTGAGMDYEVIDWLSPGEEVKVIGSEGDWYEVIVPEKKSLLLPLGKPIIPSRQVTRSIWMTQRLRLPRLACLTYSSVTRLWHTPSSVPKTRND